MTMQAKETKAKKIATWNADTEARLKSLYVNALSPIESETASDAAIRAGSKETLQKFADEISEMTGNAVTYNAVRGKLSHMKDDDGEKLYIKTSELKDKKAVGAPSKIRKAHIMKALEEFASGQAEDDKPVDISSFETVRLDTMETIVKMIDPEIWDNVCEMAGVEE